MTTSSTPQKATAAGAPSGDLPPYVLTELTHGMRVLSGVQPSGRPHLGNYLGAIRLFLDLQARNQSLIFVADLHAMTTVRDGAALRRDSLELALDYLALGMDPARTTLYRQSDLPVVTLLAWVLQCVTPAGDLLRCVSYKDKVDKGLAASAGLLCYPVLQAADILLQNAEVVPVGADQFQHIELARRTASRFNEAYGEAVFREPLALVSATPTVPGLDGQGKMSKSYGNTLPIFAERAQFKALVAGIPTDSLPISAPRDPGACNVFRMLSLLAQPEELAEIEATYRRGGVRHGLLKGRLVDLLVERFGPALERRQMLARRPDDVEDVLIAGAHRASQLARPTLERVFDLVGLHEGHLGPRPLPAVPVVPSAFSVRQGWGS
ncbi:tryptophan--tRNA ligase [Ideonella sp. 4Y16]|uniref:tryptophan--tRNA ligase n=1 Tax=Ideonella alba TaxID=2824118 RepID=UPI001B374EFD|nr:tryptophan--tRNA ligase [Ideonella alba]MBQ0942282.1 tryptophan--tRNA ligase [Ideonella alba]